MSKKKTREEMEKELLESKLFGRIATSMLKQPDSWYQVSDILLDQGKSVSLWNLRYYETLARMSTLGWARQRKVKLCDSKPRVYTYKLTELGLSKAKAAITTVEF